MMYVFVNNTKVAVYSLKKGYLANCFIGLTVGEMCLKKTLTTRLMIVGYELSCRV